MMEWTNCRHSDHFYASFGASGLVAALVDRLRDSDGTTRKFAAFAVGNAAFHSRALVGPLVTHGAVGALEGLLDGRECQVNAAGALCNLAKYDPAVKARQVTWPKVKAILMQRRMQK